MLKKGHNQCRTSTSCSSLTTSLVSVTDILVLVCFMRLLRLCDWLFFKLWKHPLWWRARNRTLILKKLFPPLDGLRVKVKVVLGMSCRSFSELRFDFLGSTSLGAPLGFVLFCFCFFEGPECPLQETIWHWLTTFCSKTMLYCLDP